MSNEDWAINVSSVFLVQSWLNVEKSGRCFKSGSDRHIHFLLDITFLMTSSSFPLGYKIDYNLHAFFYSMKFRCKRCGCNRVIIFTLNGIP